MHMMLPRFAQLLSIQWFHQIGKCAGTPMLSNCSTNMHSRGPTEQHLCALEPHRGCLLKVKKVSWYPLIIEGQQSHKYAITSPVEPMNLLSKDSNESLPKYRSTIWKKWSRTPMFYTTWPTPLYFMTSPLKAEISYKGHH